MIRYIKIMKTKNKYMLMFVDERKHKEFDFAITPCLLFTQADEEELNNQGTAKGICIKWGYWSIGFGVYSLYIR